MLFAEENSGTPSLVPYVAQSIHSLWLRLVLTGPFRCKVLILLRLVGVVLAKYSFQKESPGGLVAGLLLFGSTSIVAG